MKLVDFLRRKREALAADLQGNKTGKIKVKAEDLSKYVFLADLGLGYRDPIVILAKDKVEERKIAGKWFGSPGSVRIRVLVNPPLCDPHVFYSIEDYEGRYCC